MILAVEASAVRNDLCPTDEVRSPDVGMAMHPVSDAPKPIDLAVKIAGVGAVEIIALVQRIEPLLAWGMVRDDDERFVVSIGYSLPECRDRRIEGSHGILGAEFSEALRPVGLRLPHLHEEELAHAFADAIHGYRAPPVEIRPQGRSEERHTTDVDRLIVQYSEAGQAHAQAVGRLVEDTVIVIVVAGHEQYVPKPRSRQVGKAQHPVALVEVILVAPVWIEASGMAEIARDDEAIALGQRPAEVLPFEMQIAQVVTAYRRGPSNRRRLSLSLDTSRLSVKPR